MSEYELKEKIKNDLYIDVGQIASNICKKASLINIHALNDENYHRTNKIIYDGVVDIFYKIAMNTPNEEN